MLNNEVEVCSSIQLLSLDHNLPFQHSILVAEMQVVYVRRQIANGDLQYFFIRLNRKHVRPKLVEKMQLVGLVQ